MTAENPTLETMLARYVEGRTIKPQTRRAIANAVERFEAFLRRPGYASDLTDTTVAGFINWLLDQGDTSPRVENCRERIVTLWRWGVGVGVVTDEPTLAKMPDEPLMTGIREAAQPNHRTYTAGDSALMKFTDDYANERGLKRSGLDQLKCVVRKLERFAGKRLGLDCLNDPFINKWLAYEREVAKSLHSANRLRRVISALWWHAYRTERVGAAPRALAKIKAPKKVPKAWTPAEISRLLEVAKRVPGKLRCGISKADFLTVFILISWDTALRRSDVLRLKFSDVAPDGTVVVIQEKTGWPHIGRLSAETLEAIERIRLPERELILPWTFGMNYLARFFRTAVTAAGITPGTPKWIRRASATAVEIASPGSAQHHLGHRTPTMAYDNYVDPMQLQSAKPMAPALPRDTLGKGGAA